MCDCGCNSCGDSFSGLNGLLSEVSSDYIFADTVIDFQVYLYPADLSAGADARTYSVSDVGDVVEGCLYSTGAFWSVGLSESGWIKQEVTIRVTCATDFTRLADVRDLIIGELYNCAGIRVEQFGYAVVSVPARATNAGTVGTSGNPASDGITANNKCPQGFYDNGWFSVNCVPLPTANASSSPAQCDWNKLSFSEYAACQLGITPSKAAVVGVIAALVGVIAISKIAK